LVVTDDIEFLKTLGDDLRAVAATSSARSHRPRTVVVAMPLAISVLVAGIVVAATHVDQGRARSGPVSHPATTGPFVRGGPVPPQYGYRLTSVVGSSPLDVWAFGAHQHKLQPGRGSMSGVILRFDGSRWATVPHPRIGEIRAAASGGPDDVWAVGGRRVLHWDGSSWQRTPVPRVPGLEISSISASGPSDAWLVGSRHGARLPANSIGSHTLAMHWDGGRWSIVPTPNVDHRYNGLSSVLALSPSDVWTIGAAVRKRIGFHWTGSGWQSVPMPSIPHHTSSGPSALGTDGAGGIWAVGATNGPGYGDSLYFKWDGTRWVRVPSPHALTQTPGPSAVSGSDPDHIWAVGNPCCDRYLLAHLVDGTWRNVRLTLPARVRQFEAELGGVVTVSANDAWAVGYAYGQNAGKSATAPALAALILHWDGQQWRPVGVPGLFSIGSVPRPTK
jgi:hypothetical protein